MGQRVGGTVWFGGSRLKLKAIEAWVQAPLTAEGPGAGPAAKGRGHDQRGTGFCDLPCFATALRYSDVECPLSPCHLHRTPSR